LKDKNWANCESAAIINKLEIRGFPNAKRPINF
jgi:hypothetical protein